MFAAILLAVSIAGLSQFALYYWRAVVAGVAAQPYSDRVLEVAHVENRELTGQDFKRLAGLHDLTLDLHPSRGGLGAIRLYYRIIDSLDAIGGKLLPGIASWSERERVLCAQYAAVKIDRRLQANLATSASMRSC